MIGDFGIWLQTSKPFFDSLPFGQWHRSVSWRPSQCPHSYTRGLMRDIRLHSLSILANCSNLLLSLRAHFWNQSSLWSRFAFLRAPSLLLKVYLLMFPRCCQAQNSMLEKVQVLSSLDLDLSPSLRPKALFAQFSWSHQLLIVLTPKLLFQDCLSTPAILVLLLLVLQLWYTTLHFHFAQHRFGFQAC